VIVPEGQLAELLPDGLLEALGEEGSSVALHPRWKPARDRFIASLDEKWGKLILQELEQAIASRNGARESARDLRQKVMLVMCRRFAEHVAETGEAWETKDLGGYVRVVSRNVAKEHFRAKGRRPAIAQGVEVDERAGGGLDPEEEARHAQLLAIFKREPGILTAQEAEVFEGRVLNRMSFVAIAAVLDRNINTVYAQHRRAMEKLNAIVERVW
jgi:RNA polymerase sigma factor (sigma-70 family)